MNKDFLLLGTFWQKQHYKYFILQFYEVTFQK